MRVLYDYQAFALQRYGGISRYFNEIINGLRNDNNDVEPVVSIRLSDNYYISNNEWRTHSYFLPGLNFRGKKRIEEILNRKNSINDLRKENFDVFHATYYHPYFLKYLNDKPYVITVHDLIQEKFKLFPEKSKILEYKKKTIENAAKIIAISQSTKNDIFEFYNVDESKISIVHHSNSLKIPSNTQLSTEIESNYLLYVGARNRYKNFRNFAKAISPILLSDKNLSLICVGGNKFSNDEVKLLKELDIYSRVAQYNVNDHDLAKFYANATAFVFPSYYEGFGIPILEAFACKCPVICSKSSSFPEIAKNAAEYFDPNNIQSIYNAIDKVLSDKELRLSMISNGLNRLSQFSWKNSVKRTQDVYKSI